jgi:hypothetical protein
MRALLNISLSKMNGQSPLIAVQPMAAHPKRWPSGLEELVKNVSSWPKVGSACHERGHP